MQIAWSPTATMLLPSAEEATAFHPPTAGGPTAVQVTLEFEEMIRSNPSINTATSLVPSAEEATLHQPLVGPLVWVQVIPESIEV